VKIAGNQNEAKRRFWLSEYIPFYFKCGFESYSPFTEKGF